MGELGADTAPESCGALFPRSRVRRRYEIQGLGEGHQYRFAAIESCIQERNRLWRLQGGGRSAHPGHGRGLGGEWITCNAIAPGFFPTELTAPVYEDPELLGTLAAQTAIGRNGELADLDGLTVFLASPASSYITGQVIHLDGGFTAK